MKEITAKQKSRLSQLFNKAIQSDDFDDDLYNMVKNALTSKQLDTLSKDRQSKTKDTLDKYAGKFNLPRTIQKYIESSKVAPKHKFHFESLFQNENNLISRESLENKTEGNLMDLVSPKFKNNPLFKEVTDYLLTFRARQKGVGESWLLTFGHNASTTKAGDVAIDGYNLEVKDGSAEFSVDTKLGRESKYIQDSLNKAFFKAFETSDKDLAKQGNQRTKQAKDLKKIRANIAKIKAYLDGKGRKPSKKSIPTDDELTKYSNITPDQVKDLRELINVVKKEITTEGRSSTPGLDYTSPAINKFLLSKKKNQPEILKQELSKYYNRLYQGAGISIDELVDYIYNNIGNGQNISNAISTFLLKQYFKKEKFDVLMVVNPNDFRYKILTKSFIESLKYGDNLPGDLKYKPKFKRGGDTQNLSDGWVNIGFV